MVSMLPGEVVDLVREPGETVGGTETQTNRIVSETTENWWFGLSIVVVVAV